MPKTLADWLSHLESLHPKTIALGLERVAQVRQRLNLQPDFPLIIVGGTNGKGSVCAMLESILHAAGYKVGCYTSPHLLAYNERVRIARQQATDVELCASFEQIERARKGQLPPPCRGRGGEGVDSEHGGDRSFHPHPDLPPARGTPPDTRPSVGLGAAPARGKECEEISLTYFEFGTLAAMQCFIAHKVDVAILEVGLGGRLDAVNVFDPDVSVVTSVDIDHTDYLGDTREQIALEKAGIFRKDKVAICADKDVPRALCDHAQQIGADLWCIGSEFGFQLPSQGSHPIPFPGGEEDSHGAGGAERGDNTQIISIAQPLTPTLSRLREREQIQGQWNFYSKAGNRNSLPIPALRGAFQLNNASAVLAVLDALKDKLPVNMQAVRRGLVEVELAGRFQFVPGKPQLILDVAHNPHAAASLAKNLSNLSPAKTFAVFAMLKDKDMAGVVRALDERVDVWMVAGIAMARGANATELAQVLKGAGVRGEVVECKTVSDALHEASNRAGENDRITAFGSFHTVAEVMQARGMHVS